MRNGYRIDANVDEIEETFLTLAAGSLTREQLVEWIKSHIKPLKGNE